MNVVLDTNVLVSALLSPFGAPARVLDLVLAGDITLAFDDRVLSEYTSVLRRTKFNFEARAVDDLLATLRAVGLHVTALVLPITLPDPEDVMFLEVAIGAKAHLITGNQRHFPRDQRAGATVVSPSEFLKGWREQQV